MTTLGRRLRAERHMAGKSQERLGAEIGISQSKISRIERGQETPDSAEVRLLATALGIDPADLGASGAERDAAALWQGEEDDVRRRNLLAAGIGGLGAAALPTPAVAAPAAPEWDQALFTASHTSTLSAAQLNAELDGVARHLAAANYQEAEQTLPRLLRAAKANAAHNSRRGAELLARAYVLVTACSVKERRPDAMASAAWAVEAAHRAQHPLALAMAARAQYSALRQQGQHHQARMVATEAVDDLRSEERARPIIGHLLLESAYGAAQSGRKADAVTLWEHGRSLAHRGPSASAWIDHPGPLTRDQVERYGMVIQHTLGDTRRACAHKAALHASATTVPHTGARIRHDGAKLHRDMGDMPKALELLEELANNTPQDAHRSSVRNMVAGMLNTSPALPGLRPFATRIGAA